MWWPYFWQCNGNVYLFPSLNFCLEAEDSTLMYVLSSFEAHLICGGHWFSICVRDFVGLCRAWRFLGTYCCYNFSDDAIFWRIWTTQLSLAHLRFFADKWIWFRLWPTTYWKRSNFCLFHFWRAVAAAVVCGFMKLLLKNCRAPKTLCFDCVKNYKEWHF